MPLVRKDSFLPCGTKGHKDIQSSYFCDKCDHPICEKCVTGEHRGHELSDLLDIGQKVGQQTKNVLHEIDTCTIPNLERELGRITDSRNERVQSIETVKASISGEHAKIKLQLDKEKDALFDRLDNIQREDIKVLKQEETSIKTAQEKVAEFKSKCERAIASADVQKLMKLQNKTEKMRKYRNKKANIPTFESVEYLHGAEHDQLLGRLTSDHDLASAFEPEETVRTLPLQYETILLSQYQTKLSKIESICVLRTGNVWFSFSKSDRITQVQEKGHRLERVKSKKTHGLYPLNIRVVSRGLLLACAQVPNIQLMDQHDEPSCFIHTEPFFPLGFHVNASGEIYVCLADNYFPLQDPTDVRKVVKYSNTGKELFEIDYDPKGNNYFSLPHNVTENVNSDICVVDVVVEHEGRLLTFTSQGLLKWAYDGKTSEIRACDFSGCSHDKEGAIIVSDERNHLLHRISENGDFLGYITTSDIGIYCPFAVEIDSSGCLWIGCKSSPTAEAAQVVHIKYDIRRS